MKYDLRGMLTRVPKKNMNGASAGTLAYATGKDTDGNQAIVFFYQGENGVERIGSLQDAMNSPYANLVDGALAEGATVQGEFSHWRLKLQAGYSNYYLVYWLGENTYQYVEVEESEAPKWGPDFVDDMADGTCKNVIIDEFGNPYDLL